MFCVVVVLDCVVILLRRLAFTVVKFDLCTPPLWPQSDTDESMGAGVNRPPLALTTCPTFARAELVASSNKVFHSYGGVGVSTISTNVSDTDSTTAEASFTFAAIADLIAASKTEGHRCLNGDLL